MIEKARIIREILELNRSASADWLDLFEIPALKRYLDHLYHALEPRGGASAWLRDHETPAVVTRAPAA